MTLTRAIGKTAAWIVGIVALIIVAAGVFIVTFDWNRAKPWVNEHVSTALGRSFAINGDLRVDWRRPQGETGWRAWVPWPRISATQLEIGNPDWAKGPKFVTLDAAHFDLAILPLLAHQIVIPSIDVVNPAVDLERLADGRNTWTFQFKRSGQPTTWNVRLDSFAFAKGTVVYRDALTKADLTIGIDTLGQPIPLGDVLKEQEQKSRAASAQRVGKHGAAQLAAKANAAPASGASAAQGASGASAVAASGASA
ncbi:AsmA family protein, partial [Burkholderia latens]